jgi:hypothetical protein
MADTVGDWREMKLTALRSIGYFNTHSNCWSVERNELAKRCGLNDLISNAETVGPANRLGCGWDFYFFAFAGYEAGAFGGHFLKALALQMVGISFFIAVAFQL